MILLIYYSRLIISRVLYKRLVRFIIVIDVLYGLRNSQVHRRSNKHSP